MEGETYVANGGSAPCSGEVFVGEGTCIQASLSAPTPQTARTHRKIERLHDVARRRVGFTVDGMQRTPAPETVNQDPRRGDRTERRRRLRDGAHGARRFRVALRREGLEFQRAVRLTHVWAGPRGGNCDCHDRWVFGWETAEARRRDLSGTRGAAGASLEMTIGFTAPRLPSWRRPSQEMSGARQGRCGGNPWLNPTATVTYGSLLPLATVRSSNSLLQSFLGDDSFPPNHTIARIR